MPFSTAQAECADEGYFCNIDTDCCEGTSCIAGICYASCPSPSDNWCTGYCHNLDFYDDNVIDNADLSICSDSIGSGIDDPCEDDVDLSCVSSHFGVCPVLSSDCSADCRTYDLNNDGVINMLDTVICAQDYCNASACCNTIPDIGCISVLLGTSCPEGGLPRPSGAPCSKNIQCESEICNGCVCAPPPSISCNVSECRSRVTTGTTYCTECNTGEGNPLGSFETSACASGDCYCYGVPWAGDTCDVDFCQLEFGEGEYAFCSAGLFCTAPYNNLVGFRTTADCGVDENCNCCIESSCAPDCSLCESDTCVGDTCVESACGTVCPGTKAPDCSCAAGTCEGSTCPSVNGCGDCDGIKDCGGSTPDSVGHIRIQGPSGVIKLNLISATDAVLAGRGTVKIAMFVGDTNTAADLVEVNDPDASSVRIYTGLGGSGGIKAWRKID